MLELEWNPWPLRYRCSEFSEVWTPMLSLFGSNSRMPAELTLRYLYLKRWFIAFGISRTHTIRVASFWMLCDFRVWAPSWTGWPLASISCESRWWSEVPRVESNAIAKPGLKEIDVRKKQAKKIACRIRTDESWSRYKCVKNEVNKAIKLAESSYYNMVFRC